MLNQPTRGLSTGAVTGSEISSLPYAHGTHHPGDHSAPAGARTRLPAGMDGRAAPGGPAQRWPPGVSGSTHHALKICATKAAISSGFSAECNKSRTPLSHEEPSKPEDKGV